MKIESQQLLRLMTWLSPSFPIGGYSFSHALETAIEEGLVFDFATLSGWLRSDLAHGSGRVDAIFMAAAWRAVNDNNMSGLADAAALAAAMRGTAEFNLESATQGAAFMTTVSKVWGNPVFDQARDSLKGIDVAVVLPIAVGLACAASDIPLRPSITTYLHAWSANLVSAAVRAVPLGQTDGQRVTAALEQDIETTASLALGSDLEDVGSATLMIDILSMHHETQYTRIFRS
jgi:urease accessory protein